MAEVARAISCEQLMNDQEFLWQFERCVLPKEQFKHDGHLRVAWLYLNKYAINTAVLCIRQGIRRYATSLNALQIYHETMTLTWIALVADAMHKGNADTFDAFIDIHTELKNSKLINDYYSPQRLQNVAAKTGWLAPDLRHLPVDIGQFHVKDH